MYLRNPPPEADFRFRVFFGEFMMTLAQKLMGLNTSCTFDLFCQEVAKILGHKTFDMSKETNCVSISFKEEGWRVVVERVNVWG